jgi:multicomponent Na+:H+ antiporter subunit E
MLKKLINQFGLIKHHLYRIIFLFFVLFMMSGYASISYISIIIVVITYFISYKLNLGIGNHLSFPSLFKYLLFLLKEIFISTIRVSRIIWSKDLKISPKISSIATKNEADLGIVIFANSISLTPGTVTIDIDGQNLLIHALEEQSIDEIINSKMDEKIKNLFLN